MQNSYPCWRMTKVKMKALLHGTEFIQRLPGLCCVQDAGLSLRSNDALSCPPRRGRLPHGLGSVWVHRGAGAVGGECLGSADALG